MLHEATEEGMLCANLLGFGVWGPGFRVLVLG